MHSSIRYKGHGSGHLQNLGEPWEEGPGTNSMMGRGPWHVDDSIMKPGRILKNPGCLNTCTHLPSSNNSNLGDSTTSIVQPKTFVLFPGHALTVANLEQKQIYSAFQRGGKKGFPNAPCCACRSAKPKTWSSYQMHRQPQPLRQLLHDKCQLTHLCTNL